MSRSMYDMKGFSQFFKEEMQLEKKSIFHVDLVRQLGGRSFGKGLFKVFRQEDLKYWTDNMLEVFPGLRNKFSLFGFDWLGRCFAVDEDPQSSNNGNVIMLVVDDINVYEIPCSAEQMLNELFSQNPEALLEVTLYDEWLQKNPPVVYEDCAGPQVPSFLNGSFELSNMARINMDVYWSVTAYYINHVWDQTENRES